MHRVALFWWHIYQIGTVGLIFKIVISKWTAFGGLYTNGVRNSVDKNNKEVMIYV